MSKRSTRRKPWYRPRNVVLLLVGVLIAVLTYSVYWACKVEPNVATDYGRQMEQLSAAAQPEGENTWPHIMDAVAIYKEVGRSFDRAERLPAHEFGIDYTVLLPGEATEDERAPAREALRRLEERGALDALTLAAECPRIVRPRSGPDLVAGLNDAISGGSDIRYLARALTVRMHVAFEAGDGPGAAESLDLTLLLAQACARQPTIIEWLTGLSIAINAVRELRYDMIEQDFDGPVLTRLADVLDRRLPLPPLTLAIDGERLFFKDLVQQFYSDNGRGSGFLLTGGQTGSGIRATSDPTEAFAPPPPRLFNLAGLVFATRRQTMEEGEAFFDLMIARAGMTWAEREAEAFNTKAYGLELGWRHPILRIVIPPIESMIKHRDTFDAELGGTRLMLAIESYRAECGARPAALGDLVPEFLPGLPDDPFSPDGFVYRLLEDDPQGRRYLLYSIGCDGIDQGGETDPWEPTNALHQPRRELDCLFNHPRPIARGAEEPGD
jgi:hypothetical protein